MSKLKLGWQKTIAPKHIKVELYRVIRDNKTQPSREQAVAKLFETFTEEDQAYVRNSRYSFNGLTDEITNMPAYEVLSLPQDLQDWIIEIRSDLKEKLESLQQRQTLDVVPRDIIPEIEKLAKRLEWLIRVPEPKRPLLTEEELKGNTDLSLKAIRTLNTPWWCTDPSIHVYLVLNASEAALFNHLVSLPASQSFKIHYGKWVTKTNHYLDLVRADKGKIEAAYQEAECLMHNTHDELWKAVDALRWPNKILLGIKTS